MDKMELAFFYDELYKDAGVGKFVGGAAKDTFSILRKGITSPVKSVREGWGGLANTSDKSRKALGDAVAKKNKVLQQGGNSGRYHIPKDTSTAGKLRESGWLSNTAKYQGPDKWLKTKNTIARALPGQKTLQGGMVGYFAKEDLKNRTGTEGKGERGGRALGGAVMGIVGSRAGFVPAIGSLIAGGVLGGMAGRAGDKAVSSAKNRGLKGATGSVVNSVSSAPGQFASGAKAGLGKKISGTADRASALLPTTTKTAMARKSELLLRISETL